MTRDPPADRFEALVAAWLAGHGSANTRLAYRSDVDAFRSWWQDHHRRAPLTATRADVERFARACGEAGAAETTVARRLSALRSFFNFAVARGEVARSPVPGGRRAPTTATPTVDLGADQLTALVASSHGLGDRATVLVALLLFDGLKLAEVLAADADDVGLTAEGGSIAVSRHGDVLRQPLDGRTTAALASYLGGRATGPLLLGQSPTRRPARLTRFGADYLLKRISAEAGVEPPVSANALRRSFVSRAVETGASVESIRRRLGHTDVRTTRRHLTGER